MLSICKRFECGISYAHALEGYSGKCKDLHGHNAMVEVEVAGRDERAYQTMVMDFSTLKGMVKDLLSEMDHFDLTRFFWLHQKDSSTVEIVSHSVMQNRPGVSMTPLPATAEVMVQYLAGEIKASLPNGVKLVRVRISETPDSWAEWKEEDIRV